jgi:uncharacterized membrane protein HdeD (DUF308 family)
MRFFGTPKGRVVTGAVMLVAGLLGFLGAQRSLILSVVLTVVGAAIVVRGLIEMRRATPE